jgi:cell wall-associated NlpC family hydrolase
MVRACGTLLGGPIILRMKFGWLLIAAFTCGCASTGAVPRPFPGSSAPRRTASSADPAPTVVDAYSLVGTALSLRGKPYRNGGSDPNGFDCSGFTQYVFARHGVALPRDVRDQFHQGRAVDPADLAPGDLVFFSTTDSGASHVAIVIGSNQFVHAPSSTGVVRVERLSSSYWSQRFVGARRMTELKSEH